MVYSCSFEHINVSMKGNIYAKIVIYIMWWEIDKVFIYN